MVARGPGPHRGLGKPEREDPARVEGPAPGVRIHIKPICAIFNVMIGLKTEIIRFCLIFIALLKDTPTKKNKGQLFFFNFYQFLLVLYFDR